MRRAGARRWVRLYPRTWRARFEEEFVAMLEPQEASVGIFLNVLAGALDAYGRRGPAAVALFLERR